MRRCYTGPGKVEGAPGEVILEQPDGSTAPVWSVCLRDDASTLLAGSTDGKVRVWDVRAEACLASFSAHEGGVLSVAPVGSSAVATGGLDGQVKVIDTRAPTGIALVLGAAGDDWVRSVAAADGRVLCGTRDGKLFLYDALPRRQGEPPLGVADVGADVRGVAYDGACLAAVTTRGELLVG